MRAVMENGNLIGVPLPAVVWIEPSERRLGGPWERVARHSLGGPGGRAVRPGIFGERQQRECVPVAVVSEVEHFGESRAGGESLVPAAILALRAHQVFDA